MVNGLLYVLNESLQVVVVALTRTEFLGITATVVVVMAGTKGQ